MIWIVLGIVLILLFFILFPVFAALLWMALILLYQKIFVEFPNEL